jgi:bla regulator protein blaR1
MAELALLVRVTSILTTAWLVTFAFRRKPAALRAAIWTAALTGILLLPFITRLLPPLRVEVLPPSSNVAESIAPENQSLNVLVSDIAASGEAEPAISESASSTVPVHHTIRFATGFVLLWLVVGLVLLVRIALSHVQLARIARRAMWGGTVASVREPRAYYTDEVGVSAVAGWLRPILLLPLDAGEWSDEMMHAVLLHELAHIRRRDPLFHLIGRIACAVYWFIPLVWIASRRFSALREQACDDEVLRSGVAASAYASSLIHLARRAGFAPPASAALAMAGKSGIQERIMTILNPSVSRTVLSYRAVLTLLLTAVSVVLFASTVQPARVDAAPAVHLEWPEALEPEPTAAELAVPAQSSRICGDELDSSSSSINSNNGRRRWTIKLRGSACTVDFRLEGNVEFNDDFTDIASLSSDGLLQLDLTDRGVRRQLDMKSNRGTIERRWRVDGVEQPYDAAARAWFAEFLVELDRRTAIGVDQRLPRLLRSGGVDAVLAETGMMHSAYARSVYYSKLANATRLSSANIVRIMDQAASMKTSDYYAAELIKNLGADAGNAEIRSAMLRLIQVMTSDYYIAEAVHEAVGRSRLGENELGLLVDLFPRLHSDYYKTELLKQVVFGGTLDTAKLSTLARLARDIRSDAYAAEFIKMLAANSMGAGIAASLVDAATSMTSDYYVSEVVASLTAIVDLNETLLLSMVRMADRTRSDYYKAEMLRRIVRHRAATDRVRDAVIDASEDMSRYYREEVRRAAGG